VDGTKYKRLVSHRPMAHAGLAIVDDRLVDAVVDPATFAASTRRTSTTDVSYILGVAHAIAA